MEDYKEKLNYGSNEEPLFKDRLYVSHGLYGYNIFDRKLKVILLSEKSKEDCENGIELLLANDKEGFKTLKLNSKDIINPIKVICFKSRYSDDYYSVPTINDLYKVALYILKENRKEFELWPMPKPLDYTEKDIKSLPESFQKDAEKNIKAYNDMLKYAEENNSLYKNVEFSINNENGELAWSILKCCGIEFEFINIVKL